MPVTTKTQRERRSHLAAWLATAMRAGGVMARKYTALSLTLSVAAAVFLLVFPYYSDFDGSRTLLDANGSWVLIPILLPVVVAAVTLAFPTRVMRVTSSVVLGVFVLLTGFTIIGLCYLPAAVAMVVAAWRSRRKGERL